MRKNGAVRCTDEKEELMKLLKKLCCPLLFSLFFVAALFFPVAFASADDTVDLKLSEGTYRYDYAYEVFKLVNEERARVHLEPLVMDAELTEAAMQQISCIPAIPTSASAALYRIPVFSGFRLLVTTPQPALMSSSPTAKYLPLLPSACRISTSFSARRNHYFLQKRQKPCR